MCAIQANPPSFCSFSVKNPIFPVNILKNIHPCSPGEAIDQKPILVALKLKVFISQNSDLIGQSVR